MRVNEVGVERKEAGPLGGVGIPTEGSGTEGQRSSGPRLVLAGSCPWPLLPPAVYRVLHPADPLTDDLSTVTAAKVPARPI